MSTFFVPSAGFTGHLNHVSQRSCMQDVYENQVSVISGSTVLGYLAIQM